MKNKYKGFFKFMLGWLLVPTIIFTWKGINLMGEGLAESIKKDVNEG